MPENSTNRAENAESVVPSRSPLKRLIPIQVNHPPRRGASWFFYWRDRRFAQIDCRRNGLPGRLRFFR